MDINKNIGCININHETVERIIFRTNSFNVKLWKMICIFEFFIILVKKRLLQLLEYILFFKKTTVDGQSVKYWLIFVERIVFFTVTITLFRRSFTIRDYYSFWNIFYFLKRQL